MPCEQNRPDEKGSSIPCFRLSNGEFLSISPDEVTSGGQSEIHRGYIASSPQETRESDRIVLVKQFNLPTKEINPQGSPCFIGADVITRYEQAKREYDILRALNTRGIRPRVIDFIEPPQEELAREGKLYLVMEEIPGLDLDDVLIKIFEGKAPSIT